MAQLTDLDPNWSPHENFNIAARNTKGLVGRVHSMFKNGTFNILTRDVNGPSLDAVLHPIRNDPDGFTAYIMAKHAIELNARGVKVGIAIPDAHQVVASRKAD